MSDLNAKSSSDSEMNSSANAKEDSLDLTQQMTEEQKQHLVSDYQCQNDMISTSVETEVTRPDDLLFGPRIQKDKSEPNICSIKQQHAIRNETKEDCKSPGVTSQTTVSAKEESLDSRQVLSSPQKDAPLVLETNLSSGENLKQNHLEQTYVERDISYRAGKLSSQEQADGSDHIESRPSEVASSARDVHSPAFSHSSPNDWRRLEQELTEFLSDLEIHDEIIPRDSAAAELNFWWKRDSDPPVIEQGVKCYLDWIGNVKMRKMIIFSWTRGSPQRTVQVTTLPDGRHASVPSQTSVASQTKLLSLRFDDRWFNPTNKSPT